MDYYIRFGLWPENERSKIGEDFRRSKSWMYNAIGETQPEFEDGVSAYSATWDENKKRWVIPTLGSDSYIASLDELVSQKADIYLITGDEQIEPGSDGEPLLRNVKLIKKLTYADIYNDHCYNEEHILEDEKISIDSHKVDYILKLPKKTAKVHNAALTLEQIHNDLGGHFQMRQVLPGIVVLMLELDFPDQNTNFNIFWPSLGPLVGPIIIAGLRDPREIAKDREKYPWPWKQALIDEEIAGPPGEDFRSLNSVEQEKILKFLKKISKRP